MKTGFVTDGKLFRILASPHICRKIRQSINSRESEQPGDPLKSISKGGGRILLNQAEAVVDQKEFHRLTRLVVVFLVFFYDTLPRLHRIFGFLEVPSKKRDSRQRPSYSNSNGF